MNLRALEWVDLAAGRMEGWEMGAGGSDLGRAVGDWRSRVLRQAHGAARMYLHGVEEGQPAAREQKEVIEGILSTDYDGRTVIELLQNGHDAHPKDRTDGIIELWLDESECDHGVLYVANGGGRLTDDNFESLCLIAMSSKPPQEGIGNKGVGFKSVLQLSDRPEVYSSSETDPHDLDGYRFRFARPEDFDEIASAVAPEIGDLADQLRANVSNLKVPVAVDELPAGLLRFAGRDLCTVVRLELRDEDTLASARSQFEELTSADVPIHLFLRRVAEISIGVSDRDGESSYVVLGRQELVVADHGLLSISNVTLQDGSGYLVLDRTVPEVAMLEAIHRSALPSSWADWRGDALVSVAVPVDRVLEQGRLYTFLPMADSATSPLPGFVNAPFFARLDRRHLEESIALNDMLLEHVAHACAETLSLCGDSDLDLPAGAVVDLACWTADALPRLIRALGADGHLEQIPIIPVLGGGPSCSLERACWWFGAGSVFGPATLVAAGNHTLVSADLGDVRLRRLQALASRFGIDLTPSMSQKAGFAVDVAHHLLAEEAAASKWVDFYDDLSVVFPSGDPLHGLPLLIDDDMQLVPCESAKSGRSVFMAASGLEEDEDDEVPQTEMPDVVRSRVSFMWKALPWVGPDRQLRPGRRWLEVQRLARPFRTEPVISVIADAMRSMASTDATDDEVLRDCLRYAFELWSSRRRDIGADAMRRARVPVPVGAGWIEASRSFFGRGWSGAHGELDERLADLVGHVGDESAGLSALGSQILRSPAELGIAAVHLAPLRTFFELIGARHGLHPNAVRFTWELSGQQVARPHQHHRNPEAIPEADWRAWLQHVAATPRMAPTFTEVTYRPEGSVVHILPGQFEWEQMSPRARSVYSELLLRGLNVWDDDVLRLRWSRPTDSVKSEWPSLVGSFLATAEWFPQTLPRTGDEERGSSRRGETLRAPSQAWWFRSEVRPYLPGQPPAVRQFGTNLVVERLKRAGLRVWEDRDSAVDRLHELNRVVPAAVLETGSPPRGALREYMAAWTHLLEQRAGGAGVALAVPKTVLAASAGTVVAVDLNESPDTVYVADQIGDAAAQVLRQTPAHVLSVARPSLAADVKELLEKQGATCLKSTSEVDWSVTADGRSAADLPAVPLVDLTGEWLARLVIGVVHFDHRSGPPLDAQQLDKLLQQLSMVEAVTTQGIGISIDGHPAPPEAVPRSVAVGESRVVVQVDLDAGRWEVAEAATGALAQMIGPRANAKSLRLAILDLRRACGDGQPTDDDLALAIDVTVEELRDLFSDHLARPAVGLHELAVVAFASIELAEELLAVRDEVADRAEFVDWLDARLTAEAVSGRQLVELADRGDLLEASRELGLSFSQANLALRSVGQEPLRNAVGHEREFRNLVLRRTPEIQNLVRDRFIPAAREGTSLGEYGRLIDGFPGLDPDPAWLDEYWELPQERFDDHLKAWLDAQCPAAAGSVPSLPPVAELRETGQKTISSVVGRLPALVRAWQTKHRDPEPVLLPSASEVRDLMAGEHILDFKSIESGDVLRWLQGRSQWPARMPLTTAIADLDLTTADIEEARAQIARGEEDLRRQQSAVKFGQQVFGGTTEERQALAEAIRATVSDGFLDSPSDLIEPQPTASMGGGGKRGSGPGERFQPPPQEKLASIGFIGEVLVGEWIERNHGLRPEVTWVSGYRDDVYPGSTGDDGLGFDFRVELPDRTLLIEVKSTVERITEPGMVLAFDLGETEVHRASNLGAGEEYRIAYVTNVRAPGEQELRWLPNPCAVGGLRHFQIVGRKLRLAFRLGTDG